MPPFVRLGIPKLPCVTDRGYLAGEPGNSPPNMTPIFNKIGTIAGHVFLQNALSDMEITYTML